MKATPKSLIVSAKLMAKALSRAGAMMGSTVRIVRTARRSVDPRGVLELGTQAVQSRRDDEVRERHRGDREHDDDAGGPEELAEDPLRIDAEDCAAPNGWSKSVHPRVIIQVGISSSTHISTAHTRRPQRLVRWINHASVVEHATASTDTRVETHRELKIPRPV